MSQSATLAKQNERTTCLETFEKERMDLSTKVLPATKNCNASSENVAKVLLLPHKKMTFHTIRNTSECHEVPRHATRNEATRRFKAPKMTSFAELTIGTAIRPLRGRLRTVANLCATSSEHTLNPQTTRVKREPLLRIRGQNPKTF